MSEAPVIVALDRLFAAVSASFVRYVVETSGVEVRDDLDRIAVALYDQWRQEEEKILIAIGTRLARDRVFPGKGSWPLEFSQFHYLSGGYLLRHVVRFTEPLLETIRRMMPELEGETDRGDGARGAADPEAGGTPGDVADREAAAIGERLLEIEESFLARAKALDARRPSAAPRPAPIKGTSASRW